MVVFSGSSAALHHQTVTLCTSPNSNMDSPFTDELDHLIPFLFSLSQNVFARLTHLPVNGLSGFAETDEFRFQNIAIQIELNLPAPLIRSSPTCLTIQSAKNTQTLV
jgi:hypothetical protein